MHHMFLKLEGGSVIHWKLKACWVNNLLSQSNNFQLENFLTQTKENKTIQLFYNVAEKKKEKWERGISVLSYVMYKQWRI